jgi:hypothetical protein
VTRLRRPGLAAALRGLACGCVLGAAGCGSEAGPPPAPLPGQPPRADTLARPIEILSWWGPVGHSVKGCLSPRADLNVDGGTAIQRDKARLLREGKLVLALSGLVPKQFQDDVEWALRDALRENDIEPVVEALRSRYELLYTATARPRP